MRTVTDLARRLRRLRETAGLTQTMLGRALGVSVPLISSWEKSTPPPARRLEQYARLFTSDPKGPDLLDPADMADDERRAYEQLRSELFILRLEPSITPKPDHPLRFGPGQAITIVCAKLPDTAGTDRSRSATDADHNRTHRFADLDALIELLPVVGRLNPTATITVGTKDDLSRADLTDHVIALGSTDGNEVTAALTKRLAVPVRQLARDADDDGGFLIADGGWHLEFAPHVERSAGQALLKADVAHFLRAPNPLNPHRTLTVFNGTFSRGTYGMVRALTDPTMREHNAARAARHLSSNDIYSVVSRVRIVAGDVVVPDWTMPDDRLHEWPEAVR